MYGGLFAPGGDIILAHGYQGAFHIWKRVSGSDDSKEGAELWQPLVAPSGHFGPVQVWNAWWYDKCFWERMDGWMVGWLDGQTDGWMDGWIYRQMDVWNDG